MGLLPDQHHGHHKKSGKLCFVLHPRAQRHEQCDAFHLILLGVLEQLMLGGGSEAAAAAAAE